MATKTLVTAALCVLLALIGGGSATETQRKEPPRHSCGFGLRKVGLHPAHRKAVVNWHNERRAELVAGRTLFRKQPQAVYMRKMVYDMELEASAQSLAGKCRPVRGGNLNVSAKFGDVGQNMLWIRRPFHEGGISRTTSWARPVDAWAMQGFKFDPANIAPFKFTEAAQDYTQFAWADSYAVGCGYAHYQPPGDDQYHSLYICHYGPKGNVEGAVMYEVKPTPSNSSADTGVDNGVDNSVDNSADTGAD